jgi:hypothetical protein
MSGLWAIYAVPAALMDLLLISARCRDLCFFGLWVTVFVYMGQACSANITLSFYSYIFYYGYAKLNSGTSAPGECSQSNALARSRGHMYLTMYRSRISLLMDNHQVTCRLRRLGSAPRHSNKWKGLVLSLYFTSAENDCMRTHCSG